MPFSLFQPMTFAKLCFVRSSGRVPQLAVLKHFPPVDAAVAAFFGAELLGTVGHGVPPCHWHGLQFASWPWQDIINNGSRRRCLGDEDVWFLTVFLQYFTICEVFFNKTWEIQTVFTSSLRCELISQNDVSLVVQEILVPVTVANESV